MQNPQNDRLVLRCLRKATQIRRAPKHELRMSQLAFLGQRDLLRHQVNPNIAPRRKGCQEDRSIS